MKLKKILYKSLRVAGIVALCIVGVIVAYALIGMGLSLIPVNCNAAPGGDVVIYLRNTGVHTDIVVPTRTERIDWSKIVPPDDISAKTADAYLAFGWGARAFYLNVRYWSEMLKPQVALIVLKPVFGMGGTALHTTYMPEPVEDADMRRLSLSSAQYDTLVEYLLSSGKRDESGAFIRIDHSGYDDSDAFYEGTGHYSPIFTCNTWANSALKTCGLKCCLWTFLPHPIFWKYPQTGQKDQPPLTK